MIDFKKYQAIVITDQNQKNYFTGYCSEDGYFLKTQNESFFVTDARYFSALEKLFYNTDIKVVIGKDFTFLGEFLKKSGIKSIGVDFTKTSLEQHKTLKKLCPKIVDISKELEKLLEVKTQREMDSIKQACEITERVFLEILSIIKEGMTELDVKAEIVYRFLKYGAEAEAFDTIVAFGENTAIPHHQTSNKKLVYNSPILIDMGCRVSGYCSDFTRTFYYGEPTKDFIYDYHTVLEAFEECQKVIAVGKRCSGVDKVARDILARENLDFKHGLGHGVGVFIHEKPTLNPSSKDKFLNNSVFSVEPGAYKDGRYGIRLEDLFYLQNDKLSNFYTVNKRLIILNKNNNQIII